MTLLIAVVLFSLSLHLPSGFCLVVFTGFLSSADCLVIYLEWKPFRARAFLYCILSQISLESPDSTKMIVIMLAIKYMEADTPPFSLGINNRDLAVSAHCESTKIKLIKSEHFCHEYDCSQSTKLPAICRNSMGLCQMKKDSPFCSVIT